MFLAFPSGMFMIPMIMFFVIFAFVIGIFVFVIVSNISRERKNNNAPRITVPASVVAKRMHYTGSSRSRNMHHAGRTVYFATFQLESGDRMELPLQGSEFGLLVEGDQGKLTFQGTRFLSFERL